jgi:hypothetical protein
MKDEPNINIRPWGKPRYHVAAWLQTANATTRLSAGQTLLCTSLAPQTPSDEIRHPEVKILYLLLFGNRAFGHLYKVNLASSGRGLVKMKLSEDGADQWELLQTVHQLFSRPLKCYSDTKNVGSAGNLREERLQNYKDFFQVDVKMLLLNVQPDCELSTQAFQTCIDSLNDLLEAFENLIDDSILDIQDKKFQDPLQETSVCLTLYFQVSTTVCRGIQWEGADL